MDLAPSYKKREQKQTNPTYKYKNTKRLLSVRKLTDHHQEGPYQIDAAVKMRGILTK